MQDTLAGSPVILMLIHCMAGLSSLPVRSDAKRYSEILVPFAERIPGRVLEKPHVKFSVHSTIFQSPIDLPTLSNLLYIRKTFSICSNTNRK